MLPSLCHYLADKCCSRSDFNKQFNKVLLNRIKKLCLLKTTFLFLLSSESRIYNDTLQLYRIREAGYYDTECISYTLRCRKDIIEKMHWKNFYLFHWRIYRMQMKRKICHLFGIVHRKFTAIELYSTKILYTNFSFNKCYYFINLLPKSGKPTKFDD